MPNSLLMQYIEIIKLLMEFGPQTMNQMSSFFGNHNTVDLEHVLDFLSESKIITRKSTGANLSYAITDRGIGILTFFNVNPSRATVKLKR